MKFVVGFNISEGLCSILVLVILGSRHWRRLGAEFGWRNKISRTKFPFQRRKF